MTNKEAIEILTEIKNIQSVTWGNVAETAFDLAIKSLERGDRYDEGYLDGMSGADWKRRKRMTHELKILPKYFEDVMTGKKNFEIRKNDRDFKVGDYLLLKEWERGKHTGREVKKRIQYIYHGDGTYGLSEEFCILGLVVDCIKEKKNDR